MPSTKWFKTSNDRNSFFTVHWARGQRLTLPYAYITHMATLPEGRFVIMAAGLKVEGQLGSIRGRSRRELEIATEAMTGGRSYDTLSATPSEEPGQRSPTGSVQADPDDDLAHSLTAFEDAFRAMHLQGVFHNPEARVRVTVYQMSSQGGWEEFVP